jgi:hypothetical protein
LKQFGNQVGAQDKEQAYSEGAGFFYQRFSMKYWQKTARMMAQLKSGQSVVKKDRQEGEEAKSVELGPVEPGAGSGGGLGARERNRLLRDSQRIRSCSQRQALPCHSNLA